MYSFIEACMGVNLYVIVFQDLVYNFLFYDFKALISIEIQNPPPHTFDKYFVVTERKQVLEPDKLKNKV